jgi:hypothetical protein
MTQKYATTGITDECPTPGLRALGLTGAQPPAAAPEDDGRTALQTSKRQRVAPKGSAVATPKAVVGVTT